MLCLYNFKIHHIGGFFYFYTLPIFSLFYNIHQLHLDTLLIQNYKVLSSNQRSFKNFHLIKFEKHYEIEVFENGEFGFEDLKLLIEAQIEMGSEKLPVIVLCGEYTTTDAAFLDHLSKNSNDPFSKADAFVIKSLAQKIMANFYIKIVRPERPTKFFNTKEVALKWIKKHMP